MLVLVHGNPETAEIWTPLVEALGAPEHVRLSPPGFGAPAPSGWRATPEAYRDWLVAALEAIGEPVDIVGHDWGGIHVLAVAMTRPQLLRSWCTDAIAAFDPSFAWHALARRWETPGDGESEVAALTSGSEQSRAAYLRSIGVPPAVADALAPGTAQVDPRCILELHRSARQPRLARLGRRLAAAAGRPGLVLNPTEDRGLGDEPARRRGAARARAAVASLEGLGHWWMLENPEPAARALDRFWAAPSSRPTAPPA
jgi:pimeloyl-ACP methyl ester carboxylesterase